MDADQEIYMKFGLKLHHAGPRASPAHMLRWTRCAETLGMHLIMTADHAGLTPDVLAHIDHPGGKGDRSGS